MSRSTRSAPSTRLRSFILIGAILATAVSLGAWKFSAIRAA